MRDSSFGFTEIASGQIPELATRTRHFRHNKTGADAVFLLNSDAVQSFAIAFRTHPTDSTGVAHILEHCVLSGSRAYPFEKTFAELLKGSLQSYLNASTFADFTIFPAASPHPVDFGNLVDVYLDAVFFPLLTRETFRREGWHRAADGALQGVVLNEMKGMYASAFYVLADRARRSLFTAGPFSHDYAGDPERIPDLSHEAMRQFHQAYYCPSNSLVAYAGVDDIPRELSRLDSVFSQFPRSDAPPQCTSAVIASPRTLILGHAGGSPPQLALAWLLPAPEDRQASLAYDVLCEALIGQSFAPLRRGLIDAGHCTDVAEGRFCDDTFPPRLSIRLVGVRKGRTAEVMQFLRAAIRQVIRDGFDRQIIAAALNTVDFRRRDRASWKRPHAVSLLLDVAKGWRLGEDPVAGLAFSSALAKLRQKPAGFFEKMLTPLLLENPRFAMVYSSSDPINPDLLKRPTRGEVPDTPLGDPPPPRVSAKTLGVPFLSLKELPRAPEEYIVSVDYIGSLPVLFHHRQTNGLAYVDVAFDLGGGADLASAAFFARVLLRSGAANRSARDMAHWMGVETGGIACEVVSAPLAQERGEASYLVLRARVFADKISDLFANLGELLSRWQIPERGHLAQIVSSELLRVRGQILPKAHEFIDRRLRRHVNAADQTDGLSYLQFLHDFHVLLEDDPDQAAERLRKSRNALLCLARLSIGITSDKRPEAHLSNIHENLVNALPVEILGKTGADTAVAQPSEGFIVASNANYVGTAFHMKQNGAIGALPVALKYLETGYVWQKIREEGGAYGALCRGSLSSGIITFLSYRDPHILRTVDVFEAAVQHLDVTMSAEDLSRAIIATIGALNRPLSPSASGLTCLINWLTGWTSTYRQSLYAGVLATRQKDIRDLEDILRNARGRVTVFADRDNLVHALERRPKLFNMRTLPCHE
ncbi:MAG: insulinase family protein [Rhodobacterales bacterium]|nr:insulinase family protein [Rhodobacterales bacterium]